MKYQFFLIFVAYLCNLSEAHTLNKLRRKPPTAKYRLNKLYLKHQDEIEAEIDEWSPEDETNVWEHSGLFEGDIMMYSSLNKNGLIDGAGRWPQSTVPYYIDDSFSTEEVLTILGAMQEYHNRTCVRFRPYVQTDEHWIDIKSDYSGCWSSVGMKTQGQIVNLGSPKCLRHGVVVHELMHAIGFYHQQSSSERDDFIKIHWENIRRGRQHNFNKYNESIVTNFNITYDYDSVMHYSAKAFSNNGNDTIEPLLSPGHPLGQRVGLSEKDVQKVNFMYAEECNNETSNVFELHQIQQQLEPDLTPPRPNKGDYFAAIIKLVEDMFSFNFW